MAQKYKIYINECQLIICATTKKDQIKEKKQPELIAKYLGKQNFLLNYIDLLEKSKTPKTVVIYSDNYRQLKKDFMSLFVIVPAGGGLVVNEHDEILFIYRRKNWDLPKGKMESGESIKETAIREVMEETGIKNVQLGKKLCVTKHTFKNRSKKRAIKKSYWYLMHAQKQDLVPQLEEDIEIAVWMTQSEFLSIKRPVYSSILAVLNKYKSNEI